MADIPLRQLDIFAQMVATGSLARCAADLGVAPERIIRELEALEMRLGYRLFDMAGEQAQLTVAGRKTAQAMTLLSQDAPHAWSADGPPAVEGVTGIASRQTLTLAAPAPIFGHLQDALSAFEAANEDIAITLDLQIQSAADAALALNGGTADIAYFYALESPTDPPSRYGWSEQLNLYAGGNHPLAALESVARDELATARLLAMEPQNGMRGVIDAALARSGIRTGTPLLESDDMFEILTALRAGAGYFAAFGALARDLGRMSGIRRLALDMPLPAIEIRQAVGPRAAQTPAVEALAEFLLL